MNVFVATIGTRGDVQPYIALAEGLHRAGHAVTVCTSTRYASLVTERGLSYGRLSDDLVALVETPEGRTAIAGAGGEIYGIRALIGLIQRSLKIQRDLQSDGWAAAQEANPDVIVYHPKMAIALHYAERLGIPAVLAPLFPIFLPTGAYPNPGFPRFQFGRRLTAAYNRATHRLVLAVVSAASRWLYASWRKAHGLPAQPRSTDIAHRRSGAQVPFLNAWSRHVAPDPPDWPSSGVATTGYWFLDRPRDWTPPAALKAFLAAGPLPVYVGFGSMAGRDPERTTSIVLDALRRAGLRGVLASGWGGIAAGELPESVYLLGQVPHDWLFPRVAAVVHHGGAGTTAAGLRAGRTTVICPFFGDQPFWGRRVHEAGAGPAPIPQKNLTAERLAAALREATGSLEIRQSAAALGEKIQREDGVANAVAFIERTAVRPAPQAT
ncbi:glycosyltransferase [Salisaeta longa]|uniref:glycosyltransferase n=1 Tax=Salisaeta longa TaxID=503170 RepID=UPI0003B387A4|nr:glycosyltransferase [Salisaeta longa]